MKIRIIEDGNGKFRVEVVAGEPEMIRLIIHPTTYKEAKELCDKHIKNIEYARRAAEIKQIVEETEIQE